MRELAQWLSRAVSIVDGCGDPEAELLLQQGVTSLEDLSVCDSELLTSLPGINEAGATAIRERALEVAASKIEEEAARVEEERLEAERAVAAAAEAAAIEQSEAEVVAEAEDVPEAEGESEAADETENREA
jgi:hypothetical protein